MIRPLVCLAFSYTTASATYDLNQNDGYRGEISRDVSRTFPFHPLFYTTLDRDVSEQERSYGTSSTHQHNSKLSLGERMLSNVLLALAIARPNVGYCQGMNFVVGGLLIVGTVVGRTSKRNGGDDAIVMSVADYLDAEVNPNNDSSFLDSDKCLTEDSADKFTTVHSVDDVTDLSEGTNGLSLDGFVDAINDLGECKDNSSSTSDNRSCKSKNGRQGSHKTIDEVEFSPGYLLLVEALVFSILLNIIGENNSSSTSKLPSSLKKPLAVTKSSNEGIIKSMKNIGRSLSGCPVVKPDRAVSSQGGNRSTRSGLAMWGMWQSDVPRMQRRVFQFDRLLRWTLPRLHAHLLEVEMAPEIIVAQWMGTLFAYCLPLSFVTEIWSYIFSSEVEVGVRGEEGGWSAVFRVAMALLIDRERDILEMDLQELSGLLRKWSFKNSDNARILTDAHMLSNRINEEVLLRLEQDFALEVLSQSSPVSPTSTSTSTFGRFSYGDNDKNRGWLSRYGRVKKKGTEHEKEEVRLLRIKEDLVLKMEQCEADKQAILLKILRACDSVRECSMLTRIAEEEYVRTYRLQCLVFIAECCQCICVCPSSGRQILTSSTTNLVIHCYMQRTS